MTTIPPRGVVADMTTNSPLDDMVEEMVVAWDASQTPSEKREAIAAFATAQHEHVARLHALVAATMAWWLIKGREAGYDADCLDQVALQVGQRAIAQIARAMKQRQGEPFSPARIAIVAYHVAKDVAAEPSPPDLEGLTQAVDAFLADAEKERDALREMIDDIADMGLDDPEIEHGLIIDRCREAQKQWRDA